MINPITYLRNILSGQPETNSSPIFAKSIFINDLVKTKYNIIAKNVKDLSDAEIICLGEAHDIKQHKIDNGSLIDYFCKDGDLILTEYDERNAKSDDEKFNKLTNTIIEFLNKRNPNAPQRPPNENTGTLGSQIQRINQAQFVKQPMEIKGWDFHGEKTKAAHKMSSDPENGTESGKLIAADIPLRNRHLCKTVEENRKGGRKIFTLGGLAHFQPSSANPIGKKISNWYRGIDRRFQDTAYQETLDYLKTKKFAILVPKLPLLQYPK